MSTEIESNKSVVDKYLFFSNVKYLLDKTGIKIGELEKEANCNIGYMSRLDKKDNHTMPSIEFIQTAANLLETNIDILLTVDLTSLTATEIYIKKVFEKLYIDIKNDDLSFGFIDSQYPRKSKLYNHMFIDVFNKSFNAKNYGELEMIIANQPLFKSYNFDYNNRLIGKSWVIKLNYYTSIYILQFIKFDEEAQCLLGGPSNEVYIYTEPSNDYDEPKLSYFTDSNVNKNIKSFIERVTNLLEEKIKHPIIEKDIKNILDEYIGEESI